VEARIIVAAAAHKTKEQFFSDLSLYVADGFEEKVDDMIRRRLEGEPVAYIAGEWEFYGLPIEVSPDVLIPRVDPEVLADKAIELLKGRESGTRVLDLCCGSGCLGIAIAAKVPDCRVVMIDNSLKAMSIARANIYRNNLMRCVTCVDADALKSPPMLLGRFDLIVCNPPYIPSGDIAKLDESVRNYEPVAALDGGEDGLLFYRAIAPRWKILLKERGCMMFECGIDQAQAVSDIMIQAGFKNTRITKDTINVERVVAGLSL
jgi:release factor glutamine methyltransferase